MRLDQLTLGYMTTFLTNNPTATHDSNGFTAEQYWAELGRREDGRAWIDFQFHKGARIAKSHLYGVDGNGAASGPRTGHR